MKIDNDPGFSHTSPPRKSYNPFDSDDDPFETPGPNSENMFMKDNFNNFDLKEFEKDAGALPFYMNNGDVPWNEAMINADANGNDNLLGKETKFYGDKVVMECELPELIVCYKENSYQSVKDICIDEAVPSKDEIFNKSMEKGDTDDNCHKDDNHHCSNGGSAAMDGINQEALGRRNPYNDCETDDLMRVNEAKHDSAEKESVLEGRCVAAEMETSYFVYDTEDGNSSAGNEMGASNSCKSSLMSKNELNGDADVHDGDEADGILLEKKSGSEESMPKPSIVDWRDAEIKVAQGPNKAAASPPSEHSESQESAHCSNANGSSYTTRAEPKTITFDFNSSVPQKEYEKTRKIDREKPPDAQTMTRHDEGIPPPSSITYSGPIAYSGSISLRSESSAGSTRSFAFPVLQTEWNSSPVRMAKADRRHLRKHRGWMQALICCRFR
ncbi:hypothetical protein Nepgr_029400 [Nepenthes gracilis]|uniref:Uncharacterized protein n=1 Tax=Nepenthes gracilis TaxID=150966 RepID=A0AAD3TFB0_NEPGR|nr:hypothetical protein Nepgr_029400 [Nepenthes gracilis]